MHPTLTVSALEQDELDCIKVDPSHHHVVFENDQVRVVRWMVAVGDKTLNHSHPTSLNINLTDYNGRVTTPEATFEVHDKAGSLSWRQAGIHLVENVGSQAMEGIIVEPKKPASARPAGSPDPVVLDPEHQKIEFENEQIRVIHERQSESFPLHGRPDNVQVLLTDMDEILTTAEGNTQAVTGKAGEVRWRTATQHSGKILGHRLVEQIVVEMKGGPAGVRMSRN